MEEESIDGLMVGGLLVVSFKFESDSISFAIMNGLVNKVPHRLAILWVIQNESGCPHVASCDNTFRVSNILNPRNFTWKY